jgi:bacillithiol biosynthesis deacetylase BshB1
LIDCGLLTADVRPVNLLVCGPHPDDIEIGLGGTVAQHVVLGFKVGLCDLTAGELGSNGTVEQRLAEAEAARGVMGADWRVNLGLPDGGLGKSVEHARAVVDLIRASRPRTVAVPYWADRHPDHVSASQMLTEAIFKSGLRRFETDREPWKPDWVCYYFINDSVEASFVVDVSSVYEVKRRALACHASQFQPSAADAVQTRLSSPRFQQLIESRDAHFGALAGVAYAEGFVVKDPIVRPHLLRPLEPPAP